MPKAAADRCCWVSENEQFAAGEVIKQERPMTLDEPGPTPSTRTITEAYAYFSATNAIWTVATADMNRRLSTLYAVFQVQHVALETMCPRRGSP